MLTQPLGTSNKEPYRPAKIFRTTGIVFIVIGLLAIAIPTISTLLVEQLIAWMLVLWGIAGVAYAFAFKQIAEWRVIAACFGVVLAAGLGFVVFPGSGAWLLTAVLAIVFLMEGIISILLGLRMSGVVKNWRWIIFSGVCAFVLGLLILAQWPVATQWILGFLFGVNFLTTGISLLVVSRATKEVAIG